MQGSLYPDGVTVDQVALRRTELTKAQEILRNRIGWTCRGVYSGGAITINAVDNTRIDITQAAGFSPNGEYIQTDSAYYSIALADYTVGLVNYVCLVYTEANSFRQPHESNGYRYYTRSTMAWKVRVYTAAQYAALPATDENLANDAQDRIIFFGKVTANGAGIALTSSSVESPRTFNNILYTVPRKCLVVLGVDILAASAGSPVGSGTLSYTYTPGAPPLYDFQWTTSNGAGALVNVTADGTYTLLDGAGEWIKILVSLSVLPTFVVATTVTETVKVYNLYYQEMPRLSAEDHLHRNYIGTGVISPTNPHGMSLDDISGESFSLLDEHQDVLHCNGIWRGSASTLFRMTINNLPGNDTISLVAPAGGDLYYVNGIKRDTIDITTLSITPPAVQSTYFYEIYVSDEATVEYVQKAAYPTAAPRTVTGTWIVDMSRDYPSGSAVLTCSTAGAFSPKDFTWDGGAPVTFTPLSDPSQAIRLYAADGEHWIDLWVNTNPSPNPDETLPVANVSDTIAIFASLTDGTNQFMQIGAVSYWYNSSSVKWVLGYHPLSAGRNAVDKRIWGNTSTENMSTWALEDLAYLPNNELGRSGALLRRNGVYNEFLYTYGGAGFSIDVNGGSFYCRGQRISAKSIQTLVTVPSSVQLVWADMTGAYQVLDVTGTFSGDIQAAMRYVLGFTQNIPSISAVYHYSDAGDAPERGILLYYLETDVANITKIVDFTQNVNRVDDPWSVGSRRSTALNAVHAQAAYDNFFTAFEYAKYSMYGTENKGSVTLTVIGTVEVNFKITQPEYVNVRGTRGLTTPSNSLVRVVGTDMWGTWKLSTGCKISNLGVYHTTATTTLPAVTLHNYATVEDCFFVSVGGPFFRSAWAGDTGSLGVSIRNNVFSGAPLLNSAFLPDGYLGWIISGNEILLVPAGTTGAIELPNVENLTISDNIISIPDSNDNVVTSTGCINIASNGFQCRNVTIRNNHLSIGNNAPAQLQSVAGIYLHEVWLATVEGNTILRATGSVTTIGVGIYLNSIAQSSIVDNKIGYMGGGIYVVGYCYDTEISRNKMQGLFHSGIGIIVNNFPVLNSTYGLRVCDNDVFAIGKGTTGGLFTSADAFGIVVAADLSVGASALQGWTISNNIVSGIVCSAGVYGIVVDVATGAQCASVSINDNLVSALSSVNGAMAGISFGFSGVAQADNVSLSRNHVTFVAATTSPNVTGIYSSALFNGSHIGGNTVILSSADDAADGVAMYLGTRYAFETTIAGNVLMGLAAGLFVTATSTVMVSDNIILAKGCGLHVDGVPSERTLVHGNKIQVNAFIDNPYGGAVGWPGAHCLSVIAGANGLTAKDNILYLNGETRGANPHDVPEASSCIMMVDLEDVCIDGNTLISNNLTVDGTDGSGAVRGHLMFFSAGHNGLGQKTTLKVTNCVFDDRVDQDGSTRTPMHGLYLVPGTGFSHAAGDIFHASVKDNTFVTSNCFQGPIWVGNNYFNKEGDVGVTTGSLANRPYTIYVPYTFGALGINGFGSTVYFNGNSIHAVVPGPALQACAFVYMSLEGTPYGALPGHCYYERDSLNNFVTARGQAAVGPNGSWV